MLQTSSSAPARMRRYRSSCLSTLYDLYSSDSLQKAVTALYAKILIIMGEQAVVDWAFSWLKAATSAFTFKTLSKDYAKGTLTQEV